MKILRIENFRNGEWMLRGEGQVPAGTTLDQIKDQANRSALNGPVRAYLNGDLVHEAKKLTKKQAAALFGL